MDKNRQSIRLKNYDYSKSGYYFVTICTENRLCIFGDIVVGATRGSPTHMELNEMGKIIENIWESLPNHHPVKLDTFQIMPNHVHFIIQIVDSGGSRPNDVGGSRPAPTTVGTIVGLFKSECTKQIRIGSPKTHVWQRNYYEHIIRTENDLNKIREYIINNSLMWDRDRNNPINIK